MEGLFDSLYGPVTVSFLEHVNPHGLTALSVWLLLRKPRPPVRSAHDSQAVPTGFAKTQMIVVVGGLENGSVSFCVFERHLQDQSSKRLEDCVDLVLTSLAASVSSDCFCMQESFLRRNAVTVRDARTAAGSNEIKSDLMPTVLGCCHVVFPPRFS